MNVAVGLGRLGHEVLLQSEIGDDAHGELITAHLASSGVQLAAGSVTTQPTSSATVTLDAQRNAVYDFQLHWTLPSVAATSAQLLHTGSIAAFTGPSSARIRSLYASSPATQLRSYDPNLRPALAEDHAAVLEQVEALATLSHVVKLSDEDAAWLYPGLAPGAVLDRLLGLGTVLAVMTRGGEGALARTRDGGQFTIAPLKVQVADTVGAGDAFMSGLLHAISTTELAASLLAGTAPAQLVESALATAAASAGLTVAKTGANPPALADLDAALRG